MIMVTETPSHHFVVETSAPVNGKKQRLTVASEQHAIRIARIWNRLYIIEKLTAWLLQRAYVFSITDRPHSRLACLNMLSVLSGSSRDSINQVGAWVNRHSDELAFLAPGEKSRHYSHYKKIIEPILQFCREMEAVKA